MAAECPSSQALLLLSPAPSPPTYSNVKSAYHASLFTVLRELSTSTSPLTRSNALRVLDIALPCPHLYGQDEIPRGTLYDQTQRLLSSIYKLVTVISSKENINIEDADGIDVRVILVAFPRDGKMEHVGTGDAGADLTGPVISIQTLASCKRSWSAIYSVQTEPGEDVLMLFQKFGKAYINIKKVRGGIALVSESTSHNRGPDRTSTRKHYGAAVGGTFDHLHIGHKLLLTMFAFMVDAPPSDSPLETDHPRTMTVGISAGEMLKNKKYAECLENWDERQKSTWRFLASIMVFTSASTSAQEINEGGPNGHAVHYRLPSGLIVKLVEIWDPFGPTITDESIDVLVISAETRSGGKAVNDKRKEKGWPELDVFEVEVLDAEEEESSAPREQPLDVKQQFASKLSSTAIRKMQSDKSGMRESEA